ncbi:hypothetical protein [Microbacterium stercoris]|uniref:Uncharacterized protein n=1 Tax=Microbacterium stercoris TaxID=2820289 RepID=A0A939QIP8_9MICO|nr:hypothetical protein [Microbacterium stercoris]MBO3662825.1 hypothetical protein [Microbacterium stercoris]
MENPTHTPADHDAPAGHGSAERPERRSRALRLLDRLDAYKRLSETISDEDLATTRRTLEAIAQELGDEGRHGHRGHHRGHRHGFGPQHRMPHGHHNGFGDRLHHAC